MSEEAQAGANGAAGEDYDPFEVFDTSTGAGAVRDPWPVFARLRAASPVYEGMLSEAFGLPPMLESAISAGSRLFAAVSYDSVSQLLLDPETFSSTGYAKAMGLVFGHSILEMDPPEHRRYRSALQQAFTLKAMERWENDIVRPIVDRRIDAMIGRDRADLVRDLTFPFPLEVISAMMGLPEDDLPKFHRLAVELISISVNIERGLLASEKLREYFAEILAKRRVEPRDDLISMLAQGELEDGQKLTDDDVFAFLRLLLPAGAETTYRSSSNLLCGLLQDPAQLEALRADRSLMRQSIEEGLRWEPPLTSIARNAMRDAELCGVPIPKDSVVTVCMGSANHDPARWDEPDRFDIFRPQKPHISFATGPHTCLGLHLARMETAVALNALFDRLPNLRLDPEAEDVHITGLTFRAPRALPVVFDA
ncbi:MAG: cytochrome P450 [Deltaproteobacteria bacterium]|nr:cytochrome P450 [Deltaproteobacteria bacterium]